MRRLALLPAILILCFALIATFGWAGDMFDWPVNGQVLKQFTPNEHRGVDISASVGDPVVAAQDGVVHWVGRLPGGEPCISIDHPNGLSTTYLPVKATVSKGQPVKKGEKIGELSSEIDKSSDVSHLHLGLFKTATRSNKQYLNPLDYLSEPEGKSGEENGVPAVEKPDTGAGGLPGAEEEPGRAPSEGEPVAGEIPQEIPEDRAAAVPVTPVENPEPLNQPVQAKPDPFGGPATDGLRAGEGIIVVPGPLDTPAILSNSAPVKLSPASSQQAVSGMGKDTDKRSGNALDAAVGSQARLGALAYASAKATRPVNPFGTTVAGREGAMNGEDRASSARQQGLLGRIKAVNILFNWQYLPEALSLLTVLSVSLLGIRFARKLKDIEPHGMVNAGASC